MHIEVDPDLAVFIREMATTNGISVTRYANNLIERGRKAELEDFERQRPEEFTDAAGNVVCLEIVEMRALHNLRNSGMEGQLEDFYLERQNNTDLLQWATNEEGCFSDLPDDEEQGNAQNDV